MCILAGMAGMVGTPVDKQFLLDDKKCCIKIVNGCEFFSFQTLNAWKHFSDLLLDDPAMRPALTDNKDSR